MGEGNFRFLEPQDSQNKNPLVMATCGGGYTLQICGLFVGVLIHFKGATLINIQQFLLV